MNSKQIRNKSNRLTSAAIHLFAKHAPQESSKITLAPHHTKRLRMKGVHYSQGRCDGINGIATDDGGGSCNNEQKRCSCPMKVAIEKALGQLGSKANVMEMGGIETMEPAQYH